MINPIKLILRPVETVLASILGNSVSYDKVDFVIWKKKVAVITVKGRRWNVSVVFEDANIGGKL